MDIAGFSSAADSQVLLPDGSAHFGRDVLSGLVDGLQAAAARPTTERRWGTGALGCSMWMDDPELITALEQISNVCIVVTKQTRATLAKVRADPVRSLAQGHGFVQSALPELSQYAPKQDGQPLIVGPATPDWTEESLINAVREVGFRRRGDHSLVPIVHAKILLLGTMMWTDEHPSGHIDDHIWFEPERLWVGSANFTRSSRRSLEMGLWASEPKLLTAARRFLTTLVAISEPLGTGPDIVDPELEPVQFDHEAFLDYLDDDR